MDLDVPELDGPGGTGVDVRRGGRRTDRARPTVSGLLDDAIRSRGVSIHWLQRAVALRGRQLDAGTLVGWRTGRRAPTTGDAPRLEVLERLLGLGPGHLTRHLTEEPEREDPRVLPQRGHARGEPMTQQPDFTGGVGMPSRSSVETGVPQPTSPELPEGIVRALGALGFEGPPSLVESRTTSWLDVDEAGGQQRVTRRTTWVARRPGAHAVPVVTLLPEQVQGRPVLTAVEGCRLGPEYADLSEGVFATALELDAPLEVGRTATTEHRVDLPPALDPDTAYEHQVRAHTPEAEVVVRFHPERLPTQVTVFHRVGELEVTRMIPVVGTTVRHRVRNFGPGALGVRWIW